MELNVGAIMDGVAVAAALLGFWVAVKQHQMGKAQTEKAEVKEEGDSRAEVDIKIKELEGRVNMQYTELNTKLASMDRSMQDIRLTNSVFETRVIQTMDKLDSKLERLQDLVLKTFINNQSNNN